MLRKTKCINEPTLSGTQMNKAKIKPCSKRAQRRLGQTMVETLVAVSILGLGIAGTSKVVVMTLQISSMTKDEHVCMQLANNRLERLDQVDFGDIGMWAASNQVVDSLGQANPNGNYRIDTQIIYPEQIETNYAEIIINTFIRNRTTLKFDNPSKQFVTITSDLGPE